MSSRIRGQETTLKVIVEGQDQKGTFINVLNWDVVPRVDNVETDFCGQDESDLDQMYHGVDFTFTVQEQDSAVKKYLVDLIARQANRERPQKVIIEVHSEYREPGITNDNLVIGSAIMKPDKIGSSGRKSYGEVAFSGKGKVFDDTDE